jgi:hypothetical protein
MGDLAITFFSSALGCFDSALLMGEFAISFFEAMWVFFSLFGFL